MKHHELKRIVLSALALIAGLALTGASGARKPIAGGHIDHVCFALPVVAGKTAAARAFLREANGPRKAAFAASERRIGITRESWYLQHAPNGDLLLASIESPNFPRALGRFATSKAPIDRWFKDHMKEATGVDLNHPPAGPLSEMLLEYHARP